MFGIAGQEMSQGTEMMHQADNLTPTNLVEQKKVTMTTGTESIDDSDKEQQGVVAIRKNNEDMI